MENNLKNFLSYNGYYEIIELEDHSVAALSDLLFTTGLFMGLDEFGWEKRFCYDSQSTAYAELRKLNKLTDIPENWIAKRPK